MPGRVDMSKQDGSAGMAEVIIDRTGSAGVIRLNRPRALNSLNLGMVRVIAEALEGFAEDPTIASVIVTGEGDRGLCAGGDIRAIHDSAKAGTSDAFDFWREEFRLNEAISGYRKPFVALMDGITMGGGVGLSAHGSHRIVTERTRLAMPETGIGYFPDVGATWLLARAPGETGTWLGLTGNTVGAVDAIYAGLADYMVPSERLPELMTAIAALPPQADAAAVSAAIAAASQPVGTSVLETERPLIDRCFVFDTVEEILDALDRDGNSFASETATTIRSRSPTSLKLTLRLLREAGNSANLAECLEREFSACQRILDKPDFFEGVRAAVIDKDRNPKWNPARLADVSAADLDSFFTADHAPLFQDHRV